jgi:hypothetical protein
MEHPQVNQCIRNGNLKRRREEKKEQKDYLKK